MLCIPHWMHFIFFLHASIMETWSFCSSFAGRFASQPTRPYRTSRLQFILRKKVQIDKKQKYFYDFESPGLGWKLLIKTGSGMKILRVSVENSASTPITLSSIEISTLGSGESHFPDTSRQASNSASSAAGLSVDINNKLSKAKKGWFESLSRLLRRCQSCFFSCRYTAFLPVFW